MNEAKKTVGAVASELMQKAPDSRDPIAIQQEMQKDYMDNLIQCVMNEKANIPGDFFVVVITKRERLMHNVLRNYFMARSSCPTPDYDQAVYKYHHKDEALEFIWVLPDRESCIFLRENAIQVDPQERALLQFVLDFSDGTLFQLAKRLNGEKIDSALLEKGA